MDTSLSAFTPENVVTRDRWGSSVPRQPTHLHTQALHTQALHTQAEWCLRDSSRVLRRRRFIYLKPPYAIGPVPSLSGHAIPYRWRSLPRVRRRRASRCQGSSERVLPWQVTMDQLIYASVSHTHCWYDVCMLEVPAKVYSIYRKYKVKTEVTHLDLLSIPQPGGNCQNV